VGVGIICMDFLGKTVTLMGLGMYKTGSGVAAARFLAPRVKKLIITDTKSKKELTGQIKLLQKYENIVWRLGGHRESDFVKTDWVIRNPDVPSSSSFLVLARKHHVPIDNDITLFLGFHGLEEAIGVTGTRGKTTTVHLIYEMLKRFDGAAFMAGNVGVSPLTQQAWFDPARPAVLELSSFLLHEFGTRKFSPHIAVFTNLYPDHLNKYASLKEYAADKEYIFAFQKEDDWLVANADDAHVCGAARRAPARVLWFSARLAVKAGAYVKNGWIVFCFGGKEERVIPLKEWQLRGQHNVYNLLGAVAAARVYGVPVELIRQAARDFKGVPYRLEYVRTVDGVRYYNDSAATSPEGAIAALRSFPSQKIVLISGGNSKGLDLAGLNKEIKKHVRVLIKMSGNVSADLPTGVDVRDLKEAVELAHSSARKGDVVLLSPGLTWLPTINEFKRGDEFKKLVSHL